MDVSFDKIFKELGSTEVTWSNGGSVAVAGGIFANHGGFFLGKMAGNNNPKSINDQKPSILRGCFFKTLSFAKTVQTLTLWICWLYVGTLMKPY